MIYLIAIIILFQLLLQAYSQFKKTPKVIADTSIQNAIDKMDNNIFAIENKINGTEIELNKKLNQLNEYIKRIEILEGKASISGINDTKLHEIIVLNKTDIDGRLDVIDSGMSAINQRLANIKR